jgi:hypothetical protein
MLKRIALTAVFVATAAFGVGVAKAHSGAGNRASTPTAETPGWPCYPGACAAIVKPAPPQGFKCAGGGC